MPLVYDEEWGRNRVVLSPLLTIEEAVIVLLGKSLVDYPFEYYDENGNHQETYALEDYLQDFYDNHEKELAKKGLVYHELLLDAIDSRKLILHKDKIRANKLVTWAATNRIILNEDFLTGIAIVQKLKINDLHTKQENAILKEIVSLGYDPLSLPMPSKEGGVKHEVCSILDGRGLFTGTTVFEKAWRRLRKNKIRDKV